ncbi:MAG: YhcH/YjgK/YiaL family protein [Bacteroidota bacterium]
MIIDHINNASKYANLNPLFKKAFEFINSTDLDNLPIGHHEISGKDLRVIVADEDGVTETMSIAEFECHEQHIDIQFCIHGLEKFGWKPRNTCELPRGEYNAEKDVLFFNDQPDMFFTLKENQFVILYPEDVHAPMISDGRIRKLIFKVRI